MTSVTLAAILIAAGMLIGGISAASRALGRQVLRLQPLRDRQRIDAHALSIATGARLIHARMRQPG